MGDTGGSSTLPKSSSSKKRVSVGCQTDILPIRIGASKPFAALKRESAMINVCTNKEKCGGKCGIAAAKLQDAHETVDPSCSKDGSTTPPKCEEGILKLTISQFSKMKDTICSDGKSINGVSWRIMVMPKQHMVHKKTQKCMGFFLQCSPDNEYSDNWSCQGIAEMRLMSQKKNVQNFVRKTNHEYSAKENDWGYSCFMTWMDVIDENQGYIKNDTVVLEISVRAETPKNMISRDDFCRTIDQWHNLAELHVSRGHMDLALEANAQALKFCKDRDQPCKDKLTTQKERLLNAKLLESIQRIEKGKDSPAGTEVAKPSSLRQALTGTQKSNAKVVVKTCAAKKDRRTAAQQQQLRKKKDAKAAEAKKKELEEELSQESDIRTSSTPTSEILDDHEVDSEVDDQDSQDADDAKYPYDDDTFGVDDSSADDGMISDDSCEYGENGLSEVRESCETHHVHHHSSMSSLEEEATSERANAEMKDCSMQTDNVPPYGRLQLRAIKNTRATSADPPRPALVRVARTSRPTIPAVLCSHTDQNFESDRGKWTEKHFEAIRNIINKSSSLQKDEPEEVEDGLVALCEGVLTADFKSFPDLAPTDEMIGVIHDTLSDMMNSRYGERNEDYAVSCLASGLCTVQANRILTASSRFADLIGRICTNKVLVEICSRIERGRMTEEAANSVPKSVNNNSTNKKKPTKAAKAKVQRDSSVVKTPAAFEKYALSETEYSEGGHPVIRPPTSDSDDYSESDTEPFQTIEQMLNGLGFKQVHETIRVRLDMMKDSDNDVALRQVLKQLYRYSEQLENIGTTVESYMKKADEVYGILSHPEAQRQAETLTRFDQLCEDAKKRLTLLTRDVLMEKEARKKTEALLRNEQTKLKEEKERHDATQLQLKEARNVQKKTEKKAKQDENRLAALQSDYNELDEKMKAMRREMDQLKKKAAEERSKVKKEKEKDAEVIRRLEHEAVERENEKERERQLLDDKTKEFRNKESKLDKERKAAVQLAERANERARTSEAAQIELLASAGLDSLQRTKQDALNNLADAEDNFKRARTHSDMDSMKRNLQEWRVVVEECDKISASAKAEFEAAAESIRKGHRTLAQYPDLKFPSSPIFPKIARLPPVQVVQPSTAIGSASTSLTPSNIHVPPAGVIGQPRNQRFATDSLSSPARSSTSSAFRAQSPPPVFDSPSKQLPIGMRPSSTVPSSNVLNPRVDDSASPSPWSWNSPLNISEMLRIPSSLDSPASTSSPAQPQLRMKPPHLSTNSPYHNNDLTWAAGDASAQLPMNQGMRGSGPYPFGWNAPQHFRGGMPSVTQTPPHFGQQPQPIKPQMDDKYPLQIYDN